MDFNSILSWSNIVYLSSGLAVTIEVALFSIIFSFVLGTVLGIVRFTQIRFLSSTATLYVEVIRNLPLLLIIFFVYQYSKDIGIKLPLTTSVIISMTVFTSALVAEIVRSGLNSVPVGQMEAARSQGMTYAQSLYHVVIPQAFRRIIPLLVSQFVSLIKDTSLAVGISLPELMHNAQIIYNRNFDAQIPILLLVSVIYFVLNYALSRFGARLERRLLN